MSRYELKSLASAGKTESVGLLGAFVQKLRKLILLIAACGIFVAAPASAQSLPNQKFTVLHSYRTVGEAFAEPVIGPDGNIWVGAVGSELGRPIYRFDPSSDRIVSETRVPVSAITLIAPFANSKNEQKIFLGTQGFWIFGPDGQKQLARKIDPEAGCSKHVKYVFEHDKNMYLQSEGGGLYKFDKDSLTMKKVNSANALPCSGYAVLTKPRPSLVYGSYYITQFGILDQIEKHQGLVELTPLDGSKSLEHKLAVNKNDNEDDFESVEVQPVVMDLAGEQFAIAVSNWGNILEIDEKRCKQIGKLSCCKGVRLKDLKDVRLLSDLIRISADKFAVVYSEGTRIKREIISATGEVESVEVVQSGKTPFSINDIDYTNYSLINLKNRTVLCLSVDDMLVLIDVDAAKLIGSMRLSKDLKNSPKAVDMGAIKALPKEIDRQNWPVRRNLLTDLGKAVYMVSFGFGPLGLHETDDNSHYYLLKIGDDVK